MLRTSNLLAPQIISETTLTGPAVSSDVSGWTHTNMLDLSLSEIIAQGTKAIREVSPNNPSFSLPRAIGELKKDGLPSASGTELWREKTNFLKGSSSEYLNLEFGWKPLVSDVRKFASTAVQHNQIMEGYMAGAGTRNRRRFVFPPESKVKSSAGNGFILPATPTRTTKASTMVAEERKSWFSGSFKYTVPVGDTPMSRFQQHSLAAKKLLGVRLTPDTLWELAPWSWAFDWYTNTGDILANVSNLGEDGLAMDYGYMMTSRSSEKTTTWTYGNGGGYFRHTTETKRRVAASPYGFASTFDSLSNRQKAICAALGITRVMH